MIVSINMTREEKEIAEAYAKRNGLSLSEAMKSAFFEKIEDEYDATLADAALREFEKDPTTHTLEETKKMLGL